MPAMFDDTHVRVKPHRKLRLTGANTAKALPRRLAGKSHRRRMKPLNILLIEDNKTDILLARAALSDTSVPGRIIEEYSDGGDALRYLRTAAKKSALPDVIFLDLGLPTHNGFEVLSELRECPSLRPVPVVLLTGFSDTSMQYAETNDNNIIAHIRKPCTAQALETALSGISCS